MGQCQSLSRNIKIIEGEIRKLNKTELDKISQYCACDYKWIVIMPYEFTNENNKKVRIEKGFLSNGSNCSPDVKGSSWIVHDYLYSTHKFDNDSCNRYEADKAMSDILYYEGFVLKRFMSGLLYYFYNAAVYFNPLNAFGKSWESSGKRGPEFIEKLVCD